MLADAARRGGEDCPDASVGPSDGAERPDSAKGGYMAWRATGRTRAAGRRQDKRIERIDVADSAAEGLKSISPLNRRSLSALPTPKWEDGLSSNALHSNSHDELGAEGRGQDQGQGGVETMISPSSAV